MMDVFFTVDVEIWCEEWNNLDSQFPAAFRRYVYGPTRSGDYGLPLTLKTLNEHGLKGVFFVEPLFAARFGEGPLQELVGLIQSAAQEVQLHLHTEWVDEAREPLLPSISGKRQHLRHFSRAEQTTLIGTGLELLRAAGAGPINAFRAGNWALNQDTFAALAANAIGFDSSYNAGSRIGVDDVAPGEILTQPTTIEAVTEYPVTVYRDRGPWSLRPLQLTACSFGEMTTVLDAAAATGWSAVVIVSHNFELMNRRQNRPDSIMVSRFRRLCGHLARHADRFRVRGFLGLNGARAQAQPPPLRSPAWRGYTRFLEQLARRVYR
jgi:peptidoglycan/xylan/chitin deacetylase (PgdA/CDA1 family)